ncbi:MAG TPA: GAF domain-containing protein, partial [Blastocatellia bacterium]
AMAIAIVVAVILVGVIIFLFSRRSRAKREDDARARSALAATERENQLAAAVDNLPYSRDPEAIADELALVFREHLSIPVIAVYAGRESEDRLSNILAAPESGLDTPMPDSIPSALLHDYPTPRLAKLSEIAGEGTDKISTQQPDPSSSPSLAATPEAATTAPLDDGERRGAMMTNESGYQAGGEAPDGLFMSWRGPFDWNGIIVAQARRQADPATLDRYREPLIRLGDRLAIALEFRRERAEALALDERASRTLGFSRSLISCLDDSTPLASITREVTRLVGAESAALWRVEPGTSMVRMVAAFGLRSAEFLPLPIGQGLAGHVAQSGEPLALEDAPSDPRCIFPREARESGIGSYLGVPILSDDHAIGVVEVHSANHRAWTEGDQRSLKSAALIISEILRNTDTRGKRLRVESAYLGLSEALQRLRTPAEVMEAVVEVLGHALAVSRAIIIEFDEAGKPAPVRHEYHTATVKPATGASFKEDMAEEIGASPGGEPVAITDSRQRSLMDAATLSELQVLSEMALPVKLEGATRGVIYLHQCDRVREWQRDEIEFADRVARQLSLSLSNVRSLGEAVRAAEAAREQAQHAGGEASARIQELEQQLQELERALADARGAESQARGMLAKASAAEAKARAEADVARHAEAEARQQRDRMREDVARLEASSQQLLETNLVKGEFIVNAGHEIEGSLQSVLGLAELLAQGSYGPLTAEQHEAVKGIYAWSRRIKSDVDLMIEYGAMRSRRLEDGEANPEE